MKDQRFVSERKAAEILSLSPKTLLQWRLRGLGPVPRRFGRAVRYALTDIETFATNARDDCGGAQ